MLGFVNIFAFPYQIVCHVLFFFIKKYQLLTLSCEGFVFVVISAELMITPKW